MPDECARLAVELLRCLADVSLIFLQVSLLPMRRRRLFAAVMALREVATFARLMLAPGAAFAPVVELAVFLVIPFFFYRARFFQKCVAACIVLVVSLGGEAIGSLLWIALTGTQNASYLHAVRFLPVSAAVRFAFVAWVLLVSCVFRAAARRFRPFGGEGAGRSFALLVALQAAFALVLLYMGATQLTYALEYYAGALLLACVCVGVDVLLFDAMGKARAARVEEERARLLEKELESCAAFCEESAGQLERAAKFRHDMNNHFQVLEALVARGERREALAYAVELRARLRGSAGVGGQAGSPGEARGDGEP